MGKRLGTVLVTGGAGFIGAHLVDKLVEMGCNRIRVIDSMEKSSHPIPPQYMITDGWVDYTFARVGDRRLSYKHLLEDVETVFYLASKVGPRQSMKETGDFFENNVSDLAIFLQNLDRWGKVKRIIYSGSMAPYGEGEYKCKQCRTYTYPESRTKVAIVCPICRRVMSALPLKEDARLRPISFYGQTKMMQEQMLTLYAETHHIEFVSLRLFSVYGPRQAVGNPYGGPIPIWIYKMLNGEPLVVNEDGNQSRDFVHVKDVVSIMCHLATHPDHRRIDVYNCGTGVSTSINEVAGWLQKLTGTASGVTYPNRRHVLPGDIRHSVCNNSKLHKVLPKEWEWTSLPHGLANTLEWYGYTTLHEHLPTL